MPSNIRHYVDMKTLKSICYAILESHLSYASCVWVQNLSSVKKLHILQKKSFRLMFVQNRNAHAGPLFKKTNILKFRDKVALEKCILINNSLDKTLLKILCDCFILSFESHTRSTSWANIFNFSQSQNQGNLLYILRTKQLKDLIINFFLTKYI